MSSVQKLFETLQAPEGLESGLYEGYILRSIPEVTDGDFVFSAEETTETEQVKSVA